MKQVIKYPVLYRKKMFSYLEEAHMTVPPPPLLQNGACASLVWKVLEGWNLGPSETNK